MFFLSLLRMDSECLVPCLFMWSMASFRSDTIFIEIIRSRYSVSQSSSVAGVQVMIFCVSLQPLISTLCFFSCGASSFSRRLSAMFLWMIMVSTALHTPGLWVFAFIIIFVASFMSAVLSTYMWQFPVPVSIVGIFELSLTKSIRFFPPLGIIRSMYLSSFSISFIDCLSVDSISWKANSIGHAVFRHLRIALFVFWASEPPLSIAADELFILSAHTSVVTFGLDSYMTPMTPKPTLISVSLMLFSNVFSEIISPIWSFWSIISFIDDIIWSIRSLLIIRRSIRDSFRSFSFAFFMSIAFAFSMPVLFVSSACDMSFRILFFCSVFSFPILIDAFFAFFAICVISFIFVTDSPAFFYGLFYCVV